jgi:biotin synthase-related radical SAM superfamily protein
MSKSYKGEARAQARADQQRRAARVAKRIANENANENDSHFRGKKDLVDASPEPVPPVPAQRTQEKRWATRPLYNI